jgi:hypothetical protein
MDVKQKIDQANQEATHRMMAGEPVLVDVAPAGEVVPGMRGKMITHSGPPITWERMVLYEGWAADAGQAREMLAGGEIRFEPNHHHQAVGPMAGTITPSAPVWVVENRAFGNRAYCRQVEGRQQFGEYSAEALDGLRRWRDLWAPTLRKALHQIGGLELNPIITQALQMGDELHNRNTASSSLFANQMAIALIQARIPKEQFLPTMQYLAGHNLLFLGLAMACGKATADPARDVDFSTIVTAMCRNGTEFGIRVSGLGDRWFTAPAPRVDGLYLPGYADDVAGLDMGDSAITETVGWGAFTLGGAPGILPLVGGTFDEAVQYMRDMRKITTGIHPIYRLPALGFEGASVGIDIRKVVQSNLAPIIDTAIAHCEPGHPIIGAGLTRAPMACFESALRAFGERYLTPDASAEAD